MRETLYDRIAAVSYAREWAFGRNPRFYDFTEIGGDCTNFVSQCVYAGAGVMNYTPVFGWFFRSPDDRTASWTGVEFFYEFMVSNQSSGPYMREVQEGEVQIGDVIQLGNEEGIFYHTLIVTETAPSILVAAHSIDTFNRSLTEYRYDTIRFLHVEGVRLF